MIFPDKVFLDEMKSELDPTTWVGHDFPEHWKIQVPWFKDQLWDDKIRTYKGMKYFVMRMSWGVWNGYVFLPKGHPLHGKTYMDNEEIEELNVHGGITYNSSCGDNWVLGFDTSHINDHTPNNKCRTLKEFHRGIEKYKTHEYVINECKILIKDIKKKY